MFFFFPPWLDENLMYGVAVDSMQPWGNKSKDESQHAVDSSMEKQEKPRLLIKSLGYSPNPGTIKFETVI